MNLCKVMASGSFGLKTAKRRPEANRGAIGANPVGGGKNHPATLPTEAAQHCGIPGVSAQSAATPSSFRKSGAFYEVWKSAPLRKINFCEMLRGAVVNESFWGTQHRLCISINLFVRSHAGRGPASALPRVTRASLAEKTENPPL